MRSVQARIHAGAALHVQHLLRLVECPDPREGQIEMLHQDLATALQHRGNRTLHADQHGVQVRPQDSESPSLTE